MGEATKIQWCHHTFNGWRGCNHAGPECDNCYAEDLSLINPSVLGEWGPGTNRVAGKEAYWSGPARWNKAAEEAGERRRVFAFSLGDVFEDHPSLPPLRERLFRSILAGLPDADAGLLRLRYLDGLKLHEIGAIAGVTKECARQRINAALRRARAVAEQRGYGT